MSFTFEIKEQNDVSIISISGKILSDENILDAIQKINKHIEEKNSKLIFNCAKLSHINSTGINFFMKTLTKTRIHNGDLIICNQSMILKTGDICIFPSCFLYPHEVTELKKGTRYSFVSWAF